MNMGIYVNIGGEDGSSSIKKVNHIYVGSDVVHWSCTEVTYTRDSYFTRESQVIYFAWDRWPINNDGTMIDPSFSGIAWDMFGSYDGLVYWKSSKVDDYLWEFVSANIDDETGLIEATGHLHVLSKIIPVAEITSGFIGNENGSTLSYILKKNRWRKFAVNTAYWWDKYDVVSTVTYTPTITVVSGEHAPGDATIYRTGRRNTGSYVFRG